MSALEIPNTWTFRSAEVASEFDRHVREQLPWYDVVSESLVQIVRHYLPHGGFIYDIGASTGNVGRRLWETLDARDATLVAIEESEELVNLYDGPGTVRLGSATTQEYEAFDVAVCYLLLMFLTPREREILIQRLMQSMNPGGAIILVERFVPDGGYRGLVMSRLTLAGKIAAGVESDKILDKELSLSGIQRPLTRSEIPEDAYEWFRMGDFRGYVIEAGITHG
jgi:tRNA (cmo5U34)-methyltransferase